MRDCEGISRAVAMGRVTGLDSVHANPPLTAPAAPPVLPTTIITPSVNMEINGVPLYGTFLPQGLVDRVPRDLQIVFSNYSNISGAGVDVACYSPAFFDELVIDPDYSVLLGVWKYKCELVWRPPNHLVIQGAFKACDYWYCCVHNRSRCNHYYNYAY